MNPLSLKKREPVGAEFQRPVDPMMSEAKIIPEVSGWKRDGKGPVVRQFDQSR
jgi:hypothetical protein